VWDLWWTKWHWGRFFPEYFGFPLSVSFHRCSITGKKTQNNNNNNHRHVHHRVAQEASKFRCVRSVCCGALHHQKKKGKVHPTSGHEGPEGEQSYSWLFSLSSGLDGGGWSKSGPGRKRPGTHCTGSWVESFSSHPRISVWTVRQKRLPQYCLRFIARLTLYSTATLDTAQQLREDAVCRPRTWSADVTYVTNNKQDSYNVRLILCHVKDNGGMNSDVSKQLSLRLRSIHNRFATSSGQCQSQYRTCDTCDIVPSGSQT
jgi:hypothetical protein